jgi:hypothetical protein
MTDPAAGEQQISVWVKKKVTGVQWKREKA